MHTKCDTKRKTKNQSIIKRWFVFFYLRMKRILTWVLIQILCCKTTVPGWGFGLAPQKHIKPCCIKYMPFPRQQPVFTPVFQWLPLVAVYIISVSLSPFTWRLLLVSLFNLLYILNFMHTLTCWTLCLRFERSWRLQTLIIIMVHPLFKSCIKMLLYV